MTYLPHSLRWRPASGDAPTEWSPWHAMASPTMTLCERTVGGNDDGGSGEPVERAAGFGAVTCEACLAMTTVSVPSIEAPGLTGRAT